jgi:hypothetical protein
MLACHCVRNSALEVFHAGTFPSSQTGDYTDVTVVSPYGEIAWNRLGRSSDEAMQPLMEEIVDRLYTFLVCSSSRVKPYTACHSPHTGPRRRCMPRLSRSREVRGGIRYQ